MARIRDPRRDEAKNIWLKSNKQIKLKDLADQLGVTSSTIRKWKSTDKWESDIEPSKVERKSSKSASQKKKGAPKGNKNAVNNQGGPPKGNNNATTHGFFKRIFPDDKETFDILDEIQTKSPTDILYEQILIQYAAIARSQKIMYVRDQDDITKMLKRSKESFSKNGGSTEEEYELQFAWDKQANFMNAQSRAMSELRNLIKQFMDIAHFNDERRLKLEQMQLTINKTKVEIDKLQETADEDEEVKVVIVRKGEG
jgi:uncharacterized protein YjcR